MKMKIDVSSRIKYIELALANAEKTLGNNKEILTNLPKWYKPDLNLLAVKSENRRLFRSIQNVKRRQARTVAARKLALLELNSLASLESQEYIICYDKTLHWINSAKKASDLNEFYQFDPVSVLHKTDESGRLTLPIAEEIISYRNKQDNKKLVDLESLIKDKLVNQSILWGLFYSGCQLRDPDIKETPVIGVLLPIRFETRFYEPSQGVQSWLLRIRIFPDEISIDRHNPLASEEELAALDGFYRMIDGNLNNVQAEDAWVVFSGVVGGARGAWLVRKFEAQFDNAGMYAGFIAPEDTQSQLRFSVIRGLPETIEIWIARNSNAPEKIKTLQLDVNKIAELGLVDFSKEEGQRWWNSYDAALEVGMAAEIDLGIADPINIDVIYAVGLSDETPDQLLQAHRDKGSLAILSLGEATNTVEATPAADLGSDAGSWLDIAKGETASGTSEISQALTGFGERLEPIQGPATEAPWNLNSALVSSLWFTLWGHSLKDIWGFGNSAHLAGLWASEAVFPEGALPPIRVRQQPYGIIPATSLKTWKREKSDPPIEEVMRDSLIKVRGEWAASSNTRGTIVGANSEKILDMLGHTPSSDRYMYRNFFSLNIFSMLYYSYFGGVNTEALNSWWIDTVSEILNFPVKPQRRYASIGFPQHIDIPLIGADTLPNQMSWPEVINVIKNMSPTTLISVKNVREQFGGQLPDSLLLRLLMHSITVGMAEVSRFTNGKKDFYLEKEFDIRKNPTRLAVDAYAFKKVGSTSSVAQQLLDKLYDSLDVIQSTPVDQIERALRSVLDSASHRIDPWISAYAWRRYNTLKSQQPKYKLGIYGWVDNPKTGKPGPTVGGLLHAPSEQQCYTSMIIRDKSIYDSEQGRWKMNLDSKSIRNAERIADEVRAGNHLKEILGREIELVVAKKALIEKLRKQFPLNPESGLRRVCDGEAVLNAVDNNLGLPNDVLKKLDSIREALDVYGDLLVAEAVNHVVEGRGEVAGAAMDAAAGLVEPPSLDVIKTPRSGRTVSSTVVFCLPVVDVPLLQVNVSPTVVADASVAEWIKQQTGEPDSDAWKWNVVLEDLTVQELSLSDLGLMPHDVVGLSRKTLDGLALKQINNSASIAEDSKAHESQLKAQRIIRTLGARPAIPKNLVFDGTDPSVDDVVGDLKNRVDSLKTLAELVINELEQALNDNDDRKINALHIALKWGIYSIDEAELSIDDKLQGAIDAIAYRVAQIPGSLDGVDAPALAKMAAEFVTNDGQYAILARIDIAKANKNIMPVARDGDDFLNTIDSTWLNIVAAVRKPVSRVESYQLELLVSNNKGALHAWSNRPNDPWQKDVAVNPQTARVPDSHLLVAYGPKDVLKNLEASNTFVRAVGLVDSWSEMVPMTEHATTAGFGFNAPSSRAQQSIILAVPPRESNVLDNSTIMNIIEETRELCHARMLKPEDLANFSGGISTMMFPGMGSTKLNLEPDTSSNDSEEIIT